MLIWQVYFYLCKKWMKLSIYLYVSGVSPCDYNQTRVVAGMICCKCENDLIVHEQYQRTMALKLDNFAVNKQVKLNRCDCYLYCERGGKKTCPFIIKVFLWKQIIRCMTKNECSCLKFFALINCLHTLINR